MTNTQPRNDAVTLTSSELRVFDFDGFPPERQRREPEPHYCRRCGAPARNSRAYLCADCYAKEIGCRFCGAPCRKGTPGTLPIKRHCDAPECVKAAREWSMWSLRESGALRSAHTEDAGDADHDTEYQLDQYGEPQRGSELHPVQHVNIDTEGHGQ